MKKEIEEIAQASIAAHAERRAQVFLEASVEQMVCLMGVNETLERLVGQIDFLREYVRGHPDDA